jgi:hypothetical protein
VLNPTPASALTGPILDDVSYPDVLVARAISDGDDLRLVLRPGRENSSQILQLARLQPNRRYQVAGSTTETLVADARGRAELAVVLSGRTEIRLVPE